MNNYQLSQCCFLAVAACASLSVAAQQPETNYDGSRLARYDKPVQWNYGSASFKGYTENRNHQRDSDWTKGGIIMRDENQRLDIRSTFKKNRPLHRYEENDEYYDHQSLKESRIDYSYALSESGMLNMRWDVDDKFEVAPSFHMSRNLKMGTEWNSNNEFGGNLFYQPFRKLKLRGHWNSTDDFKAVMLYKPHKLWRIKSKWKMKDNRLVSDFKYKGFGDWFEPSVGVEQRSTTRPNIDSNYNQREAWIKVESDFSRKVILTTQYTFAQRDYLTPNQGSSKYGRHDERNRLNVTSEYRGKKYWWYLDYELGLKNSNVPSESETKNTMILWLVRDF